MNYLELIERLEQFPKNDRPRFYCPHHRTHYWFVDTRTSIEKCEILITDDLSIGMDLTCGYLIANLRAFCYNYKLPQEEVQFILYPGSSTTFHAIS